MSHASIVCAQYGTATPLTCKLGCGKSATVTTKLPPLLAARLALANEHWLAVVAADAAGNTAPAGSKAADVSPPLAMTSTRSITLRQQSFFIHDSSLHCAAQQPSQGRYRLAPPLYGLAEARLSSSNRTGLVSYRSHMCSDLMYKTAAAIYICPPVVSTVGGPRHGHSTCTVQEG